MLIVQINLRRLCSIYHLFVSWVWICTIHVRCFAPFLRLVFLQYRFIGKGIIYSLSGILRFFLGLGVNSPSRNALHLCALTQPSVYLFRHQSFILRTFSVCLLMRIVSHFYARQLVTSCDLVSVPLLYHTNYLFTRFILFSMQILVQLCKLSASLLLHHSFHSPYPYVYSD